MGGKATRHLPAVTLVVGLLVVAEFIRFGVPEYQRIVAEAPVVFALMLAGTLVAVLRNEVGISTFGVFGPVIFAYAWLELGPVWGAAVVLYVFSVAMTTRLAIEPLSLGTPHRMGVVLVTVGIAVLGVVAIGRLELVGALGTALLFPVLLAAWYGDRFVGQVYDVGWARAGRRLGWTLVVITLAYLVISYQPLMSWFAATPEAWVALVALNLLLGTATTVRVSELLRFDTLRRSLRGGGSPADVLTMRVRNREFIDRYNPRHLLVSMDKTRTKDSLEALGVPTPETYAVIASESQLGELRALLERESDLVLKPTDGRGGEGIVVVTGREGDRLVTSRGEMTVDALVEYVRSTVQGRYATGYDTRGSVLVEERVEPDGLLAGLSGGGVPDVRVVVLEGYPVMAMARLPTRASTGTANLHGGAVGVSVDIADGVTGRAYQQTTDRWLDNHPDTGQPLTGVTIPEWDAVLETASRAAAASHLGYAGVDIVFDAERGPLVLEVNRRPGLGIQNVNLAGLLGRLRFVEAERGPVPVPTPAAEKVRQAQEWHRLGWGTAPPVDETPSGVTA
jgi:alpha-L-glutamate ligase-like protein